jgi:hypothetical protein
MAQGGVIKSDAVRHPPKRCILRRAQDCSNWRRVEPSGIALGQVKLAASAVRQRNFHPARERLQ